MPEENVLAAEDNFYQAFPNLYAIRGTSYRDVRKWSDSLAQMAAFNPEHLVGGHTLPISGVEAVQALIDYGFAIRSIYDQTVAGINQGKTPDVIAHDVRLPDEFRDKSYLVEFYGTVAHSTRAVFAGLLGWFHGYLEIARETKIAALRGLAAQEYNAPNRNYYLTYARELESGSLAEVWF